MSNLGDPILKKLTTGRLLLQLLNPANNTYDAFWRDLGNTDDYKYDPKINRKEHMASAGGVKRTDLSLISDLTAKFSFTFDEFSPDMEAIYTLGTQGADAVQAGGNVAAEQLTANSQQGRVYFAAQKGLSAVVVKIAGAAKVLGVDYSVDLGSGAVTILNGGGINNGSTVTIDYTSAAITEHTYTGLSQLITQCRFKVLEYDQFLVNPRKTTIGNGQIYVTGWGDNKNDFTKPTVELLVIGLPTVNLRAD